MKHTNPPRWAEKFLQWYCNPELLEDIAGDVNEIFQRQADARPFMAKVHFVWNVIRFCRIQNIKRSKEDYRNQLIASDMLKSYIVSAVRSLIRNRIPSAINIIGLSIALGAGITIFLTLDSYYNRDTFHEKGDRLFLLMNEMKSGDIIEKWARSPYLLGTSLKEAHSSIEHVVRIQRDNLNIRNGEVVFNEPVWFVDPDFFDAFSYPIQYGDRNTLFNKNSIVITEDVALKYFGRKDVINEELSIKFPDDTKSTFSIGAVLAHVPDGSSMYLSILIPMSQWEDHADMAHNIQWRTWSSSTFIVMKEGHQPLELNAQVDRFRKIQHEANDKFQVESVTWIPMTDVAALSYDIKYALSWSNIPAAMILLGIIATLLVLLACFNYMNVAVAAVSTRLKEIGIRKVIGGSKRQIIYQFLSENLVLCFLATMSGTGISYFILLPGFNSLYPIHVPFSFSSTGTTFIFFGLTLLTVSLVSGGYPAFYISSFNPVTILKGKEKFGNKSLFSKILLSLQLVISFTTIVASLIFISTSKYFEEKDWGYQHVQQMFISVNNQSQYDALRNYLSTSKYVINYAGSESHIGFADHSTTVSVGNDQISVVRLEVGFDYPETMDLRLEQGRLFNPNVASDKKESVVINEAFTRKLNWKQPIGKSFDFDGQKWYVIGVVKDFNYKEFFFDVDPMMMHTGSPDRFRFIVAKVEPGKLNLVNDQLKKVWASLAPDEPYQGFYQDKVFQQFFDSNRSNNKIMYVLSTIALVLACMGLYGLISYNLTRRLKEFSIRKIYGARLLHILREMNRDYAWIVFISFATSAPLGFYLSNIMIKAAYPEDIPLPMWPFVTTAMLVMSTIAFTILSQLRRISIANPTQMLRND
ncbi:MAG: ABC transporter permease [Chryseolinea sp.]